VFVTDVDGTLTDGGMYYSADGEILKRFDTRDAFGMNRLRHLDVRLAIVTAEDSPIVLARARKMRIEDVYVNVPEKLRLMGRLLEKWGLGWQHLAYVGDDLNDLPVLEQAGFSACPADAAPEVARRVHYVCRKNGGHGAVREVCDFIVEALGSQGQPGGGASGGD
jgi:N-acylneuraminate cytidylyltransferase